MKHIVIVCESHPSERHLNEVKVDDHSERRTADYIVASIMSVVNVVVVIVVHSPVTDTSVAWRQSVDPVSEVVRLRAIEMTRSVVSGVVTLTRRYAVQISSVIKAETAVSPSAVIQLPESLAGGLISGSGDAAGGS